MGGEGVLIRHVRCVAEALGVRVEIRVQSVSVLEYDDNLPVSMQRDAMHVKLGPPNSFGEYLWLVVPDRPLEELGVVWLVLGETHDHMKSVCLPIPLTVVGTLARELQKLESPVVINE
jgi:hypothetical protein